MSWIDVDGIMLHVDDIIADAEANNIAIETCDDIYDVIYELRKKARREAERERNSQQIVCDERELNMLIAQQVRRDVAMAHIETSALIRGVVRKQVRCEICSKVVKQQQIAFVSQNPHLTLCHWCGLALVLHNGVRVQFAVRCKLCDKLLITSDESVKMCDRCNEAQAEAQAQIGVEEAMHHAA